MAKKNGCSSAAEVNSTQPKNTAPRRETSSVYTWGSHVYAFMWRRLGINHRWFSLVYLVYLRQRVSLQSGNKRCDYAGCPETARILLSPLPQYATMPGLLHGFWGLNTGPHACPANTLQTVLCPQPILHALLLSNMPLNKNITFYFFLF